MHNMILLQKELVLCRMQSKYRYKI